MNEPTCLLADDHPALTAAVSAYLSENGFTIVGPAPDGRRAVAARDGGAARARARSTTACRGSQAPT